MPFIDFVAFINFCLDEAVIFKIERKNIIFQYHIIKQVPIKIFYGKIHFTDFLSGENEEQFLQGKVVQNT